MPKDRLREAVARGVTWFGREQTQGGWWVDLSFLGQPSDEYVTAFVTANLAGLPGAEQFVSRARTALLDRLRMKLLMGTAAGWGWNLRMIPDADSTAWGLRAVGAAGLTDSDLTTPLDQGHLPDGEEAATTVIRQARGFLGKHLKESGVCTFMEESGVRAWAKLPSDMDCGGWFGPATCVTAAAAGPGGTLLPAAVPILLAAQETNGLWRSYWWPESAYSTGLACLALNPQLHQLPITAAARWAVQRGQSDSAFATAWRLSAVTCALKADPDNEQWKRARDRMSEALFSGQLADGSWPASAEIALPAPSNRRPDYSLPKVPGDSSWGVRSLDHGRTLTTASVLAALARC